MLCSWKLIRFYTHIYNTHILEACEKLKTSIFNCKDSQFFPNTGRKRRKVRHTHSSSFLDVLKPNLMRFWTDHHRHCTLVVLPGSHILNEDEKSKSEFKPYVKLASESGKTKKIEIPSGFYHSPEKSLSLSLRLGSNAHEQDEKRRFSIESLRFTIQAQEQR